jgi:hypothetical protein
MDWVPWVIRAILIVVGIILAIIIWKGKKEGRYQEYSLRFFVIGATAFISPNSIFYNRPIIWL